MKILLFPVALLFACLIAGFYGVIHNQISYSVAPVYFHEFKFIQFQIDPKLQNRLGASLVGWYASWWMGILIGLPVYFTALFVRGNAKFARVYAKAAVIIVSVTLIVGLGALFYSYISISDANLPRWALGRGISDPLTFSRAGTMHNFSYLGGGIGLVLGLIFTIRSAWLSRQ